MRFNKISLRTVFGLAAFSLLLIGNASAQDMGQPKFVDVDGIKTRYFEAGSGGVLVLIHGGGFSDGGNATGWKPIFGGLAQHFHVYAFDKLGQGETDPPKIEADYNEAAVIRHAWGFIQKLGLQNITIAGHSRGALPAGRIAVDHPETVKNLVIFDSNTLSPDDPSTDIYYYDKGEAANPNPLPPKVQRGKDILTKLTADWVSKHREQVKKDPQLGVMRSPSPWWLADTKLETHQLIREGHLKVPTLIIWGYNDPSAPIILATHTMNLIFPVVPRTELHVLNHAQHSPYTTHPEECIRLIVNFVKHPLDSK